MCNNILTVVLIVTNEDDNESLDLLYPSAGTTRNYEVISYLDFLIGI